MTELNNERANRAAEEYIRRLGRYPLGIQYAVGLILPNLLNGCSWGFLRVEEAERESLEAMVKEPSVGVVPLKNGFLVEMDFDHCTKLAQEVSVGIYSASDFEGAVDCRNKAVNSLVKFAAKMDPGVRRIGFYNLNDSPSITVNGVVMPSFNVNMFHLCTVMDTNGMAFRVGEEFVTPAGVSGNQQLFFRKGCELAPSGNSLLVEIAKRG